MPASSTTPRVGQETAMHQNDLSWFERLLIKIALAKAVARGGKAFDAPVVVRSLKEAFAVTRAP